MLARLLEVQGLELLELPKLLPLLLLLKIEFDLEFELLLLPSSLLLLFILPLLKG